MCRIIIAVSIFYFLIELIAPKNVLAFGKQKDAVHTKPAVFKPVVLPTSTKSLKAKQTVITPTYTKPVAAEPVVKQPVEENKPLARKASKKQTKDKVTYYQKVAPLQATKTAIPVLTQEPTTGQTVNQGSDTVSGLFNKFKSSVSNPAIQKSCSAPEKAMSQC